MTKKHFPLKTKACFQLLTDPNGNNRRCCEPWGTEHCHDLDAIKSYEVALFHDYVLAHGFGAPTVYAYRKAANLISAGMHTAEAAAEIVALKLTTTI